MMTYNKQMSEKIINSSMSILYDLNQSNQVINNLKTIPAVLIVQINGYTGLECIKD